jgi:hypothetical protein
MNEAKTNQGFQREFHHISKELRSMNGFRYVQEIWEHAENPLSPTELYCVTHWSELPEPCPDLKPVFLPEVGYTICNSPNTPVPLTDRKAVRQIKGMAAAMIINLDNARQDGDETLEAYCQTELTKLWYYLSTSVSKNGNIKHEDNVNRKHQLLIYRAVQKFCVKLHESHPELAEHICEHIVIRMRCYWSDVPIKRKG